MNSCHHQYIFVVKRLKISIPILVHSLIFHGDALLIIINV